MIHYTILPHELIFEEDEEKQDKKRLVEVDGVTFLVEPSTDMEYTIVQLISTDPQHFLNQQYQPGQKLSLKPSFSEN